jgi:hypothetical protein
MAARDGDVDDAEARIDELERELDRVATALRDVAATGESRSVD